MNPKRFQKSPRNQPGEGSAGRLVIPMEHFFETETSERGTGKKQIMKYRYNELKLKALSTFEGRGWLSPSAWAVLAGYYPIDNSYGYIKRRLWRWRLLDRSLDRRGLLLYRLNRKGAQRLAWLRERMQ